MPFFLALIACFCLLIKVLTLSVSLNKALTYSLSVAHAASLGYTLPQQNRI